MPPLKRPTEIRTVRLPPREARLAAEAGVLVIGGGLSGIGAAVGAARAGADVVLAERYGFFGGHATAALVTTLASYHVTGPGPLKPEPALFPTGQGRAKAIIAGVLKEFVAQLIERGGAVPPGAGTGYIVAFDAEVFKQVAQGMLDAAGVNYLMHTFASGVIGESGSPSGVILESKSGPLAVMADCIIDCTGDGDIAAAAGAPYEIGQEDTGAVQPMTMMFLMAKYRKTVFDAYVQSHPGQWYGNHGLWDLIKEATAAGDLDLPREDMLFFETDHEEEAAINSSRIVNALGIDVWDLTRAEWEGHRQVRQIAAFLKKYVPGFEESYVSQSGTTVGVRETRRIMGEYALTIDDVLGAHHFDDVIARGSYPIDIHNPSGRGTVLRHLSPGESYDIPLRCLIPQKTANLLVAGRCISGTHEAQSSYRVMPISMATGQAAGVCAALSVRTGKPPREVPVIDVQDELLKQGANLGDIRQGIKK